MAPRSSWKGFLKLSLVSVPVKAFTANATGGEVHLNQLHQECNSRIQYKKTCPLHGEVSSDEIVSGYEYAKGQYVVIDPDEVDKLRTASDRSVTIDGFIEPQEVDPVYYAGRTYYLVPDGPVGQKPYSLLNTTMRADNVLGMARTVIAGREQLVLVRPVGRLLAMTVVQYASRVKGPTSFEDEIDQLELADAELKLAHTLVEASRLADFDLARYEDTYTQKLTRVIEAKVEGQEIVSAPDPEEPKIINLMEALKQSVANAQSQAGTATGKRGAAPTGRAAAVSSEKLAPSARPKKANARKKKSG